MIKLKQNAQKNKMRRQNAFLQIRILIRYFLLNVYKLD